MKKFSVRMLLAIAALFITFHVHAAEPEKQQTPPPRSTEEPSKPPAATAAAAPVYKPPLRGAPGGRVGGGTRGTGRAMFVLSVLAPDHTGLTISEQPSLYWFISSAATSPVEVTVVDPRATKPLLEIRLPSPIKPGVHRINLAEHNVRLGVGIVYRWYVAVVPDANRRAKDLLTGGAIERVEPPKGLRVTLAQAARADAASLYAEAGIWYDAIAALSDLIASAPSDSGLHQQRAAMLAQVGLPDIGE